METKKLEEKTTLSFGLNNEKIVKVKLKYISEIQPNKTMKDYIDYSEFEKEEK